MTKREERWNYQNWYIQIDNFKHNLTNRKNTNIIKKYLVALMSKDMVFNQNRQQSLIDCYLTSLKIRFPITVIA